MTSIVNWGVFIVLLIGSCIQLFLDIMMGADIPVVLTEGEFIRFIKYSGILFTLFMVYLALQRKISILIINALLQIIIFGWWMYSLESSFRLDDRVDELIYGSFIGLGTTLLITTYSLIKIVAILKESGKIRL